MPLPTLPARAAYIHLNNPSKRNALSLAVLQQLRAQLHTHLTSPVTGKPLLLPPFDPALLDTLLDGSDPAYKWLTDAATWNSHRASLPSVLVLRSTGPVFSAGHDLSELTTTTTTTPSDIFALCADVMALIRRSPAPVVCPVHGLATAAGCTLALATDLPIALANTPFRLPGMTIGLPCTGPAVAVTRRVPPGLAYRMFATAAPVTAAELGAGVLDVVAVPEHAESTDTATKAFEDRVAEVVQGLARGTPAQAQALGKWAFWTQMGIERAEAHGPARGDGYEDAAAWAAKAMALHARSEDAREGVAAWLGRRSPVWKS